MMRARLLLAVLFIFLTVASRLTAQQRSNVESLGDAIDHMRWEKQSKELLMQILEFLRETPRIDSHHDACGSFDIDALKIDEDGEIETFSRLSVSFENDAGTVVLTDTLGFVTMASTAGETYAISSEGKLQHFFSHNECIQSPDNLLNLWRAKPDSEADHYVLDVGDIFEKLFSSGKIEIGYRISSNVLVIEREDGPLMRFRLASPQTQLRTKYPFAYVELLTADRQVTIRYSQISRSPADIDLVQVSNIPKTPELAPLIVEGDPLKTEVPRQVPKKFRNLCRRFSNAVTGIERAQFATLADYKTVVKELPIHQKLLAYMTLFEQSAEVVDSPKPNKMNVKMLNLNHNQVIFQVSLLINRFTDRTMRANDYPLATDDPCFIWQDGERMIGETELMNLTVHCTGLIKMDRQPTKSILTLASAMGDIGCPPINGRRNMFKDNADDDPLFQGISNLKWKLPGTPEQAEAVADWIRQNPPGDEMTNLAVEALLHGARFDKIDDERLEAWFKEKCSPDSVAWDRTKAITLLSACDVGQGYLLEKMQDEETPTVVHQHIADALHARVSAVRQLKRYDFVSRKRCEEIEAALANERLTVTEAPEVDRPSKVPGPSRYSRWSSPQ
ncbi:hypothetical protein GC197_03685 [bacterium]|nr:hypothetical protein [bacterium]